MKNVVNNVSLQGYLYEHNLTMKTSGPNSKNPGTQFISGTISVATNSECTNIVDVHYTYVTAVTGNGNANRNFQTLSNIINGVYGTIMANGKENAARVRVDTAIGLNEFYSDRNGKEELVSVKRNEGGFIHVLNATEQFPDDENKWNKFLCDMIITNVIHRDADETRGMAEKAIVKGIIFDFRKAALPVEFSVTNPGGIAYFESLGVSPKEPFFTQVWGKQISETITRTQSIESAAWGESYVDDRKTSRKDYVITGLQTEGYVWDDESTITVAEFQKLSADRQLYLASVKQRQDDYQKSKNSNVAAPTQFAF